LPRSGLRGGAGCGGSEGVGGKGDVREEVPRVRLVRSRRGARANLQRAVIEADAGCGVEDTVQHLILQGRGKLNGHIVSSKVYTRTTSRPPVAWSRGEMRLMTLVNRPSPLVRKPGSTHSVSITSIFLRLTWRDWSSLAKSVVPARRNSRASSQVASFTLCGTSSVGK